MTEMRKVNSLGIFRGLIAVFTIEKIIQHAVLALFFFIEIPGIGTPDIGPFFTIDTIIMGFLNVVYCALFCLALGFFTANKSKSSVFAIVFLAALDILLEFIFHGFFFITVSVIMSTILIIISFIYLKKRKLNVE